LWLPDQPAPSAKITVGPPVDIGALEHPAASKPPIASSKRVPSRCAVRVDAFTVLPNLLRSVNAAF
jgi:hypothetical protein